MVMVEILVSMNHMIHGISIRFLISQPFHVQYVICHKGFFFFGFHNTQGKFWSLFFSRDTKFRNMTAKCLNTILICFLVRIGMKRFSFISIFSGILKILSDAFLVPFFLPLKGDSLGFFHSAW